MYSAVLLFILLSSNEVISTDVAKGPKCPSSCLSRLRIKLPLFSLSKQPLALQNKQSVHVSLKVDWQIVHNRPDPDNLHSVFYSLPIEMTENYFLNQEFRKTCQIHWKRKHSEDLTNNSLMLLTKDGCSVPCILYSHRSK